MVRSYYVQLYPTKAQAALLARQFGCCRWLYNASAIMCISLNLI